ncbi:hypothetical protein Glove_181g13 [Diversispora epigaea]|uniref:Retrotransposon gag domain-containing protein n=1 Tax=Diversispora epigaea TaxID=1348612 RepID=A0A397IQR6_9GLOM|nr:hypothetical protein Glove_181g13 [Diversispora epigaea]
MQGNQSVNDYFKMIKIYAVALRNNSVIEYYAKIKKYNKTVRYEEEQLRYQFLCGLNSDNQLEVEICGLELPLEKLIKRLSAIENIRKMHSIYV